MGFVFCCVRPWFLIFFCRFDFLHCQPMDGLPKAEAATKAKKAKIEKKEPHNFH
jgi:hypothetical protein